MHSAAVSDDMDPDLTKFCRDKKRLHEIKKNYNMDFFGIYCICSYKKKVETHF
jgi:hypothetical protein